MLLLPGGQMDKVWEPSKKQRSFGNWRALDRKVFSLFSSLTLILLTWRIWWASNNASRWQMEFNSVFKGLKGKKDYDDDQNKWRGIKLHKYTEHIPDKHAQGNCRRRRFWTSTHPDLTCRLKTNVAYTCCVTWSCYVRKLRIKVKMLNLCSADRVSQYNLCK
jgi:hypothetical protein